MSTNHLPVPALTGTHPNVMVPAAIVRSPRGVMAITSLAQWIVAQRKYHLAPMLPRAIELFWGDDEFVAYKWGSEHPIRKRQEPQFEELETIAGLVPNSWISDQGYGSPELRLSSLSASLDYSITTTGGPVYEGLSRTLFEYRGTTDDFTRQGAVLPLPFTWVLSQGDVRATITQLIGSTDTPRPGWLLDTGYNQLRSPLDDHGHPTKDYLLVTRVRNFLNKGALDRGSYILNFAGLHRYATRAATNLVRSRRVVNALFSELRDVREFQVIIEVSLKHGPHGLEPGAMEIYDTRPLEITDAQYVKAQEEASGNLVELFRAVILSDSMTVIGV